MELRCSIIVSCYNKAGYIRATVDSALNQTYPLVEVIVVDDGSSDGSRSVLESYGPKIKLISKPNAGQASAINTGFREASGDIIFLLDGDDLLLPETVAAVARMWQPGMSKVHFCLQKISGNGEIIVGRRLPPYRELPKGDLRPMILKFGFYPSPPMSGNAFGRRFLEAILPLNDTSFRVHADTPIIGLAPLFGEVGRLTETGGQWREHDNNASSGGLDVMRKDMAFCEAYLRLAQSQLGSERTLQPRWPYYLKRRLVVAKFDPAMSGGAHLRDAAKSYLRCVIAWPEYDLHTRMKFLLWAFVIWWLPLVLLRRIPGLAGPKFTVT